MIFNKITKAIFLCTILLVSAIPSFALDDASQIKVGIDYEDDSLNTANFSGNSLSLYSEDALIFRFSNLSNIDVSKAEEIFVKIPQKTQDYDQFMTAFLDYKKSNFYALPGYDQNYNIYAGPFKNEVDAFEFISQSKDDDLEIANPSHHLICSTKGTPLFIYNASSSLLISSSKDTIKYNEKPYRGAFLIKRLKDSDFTVINQLPIKEYLYGVVPSEVNVSWPEEALKAQAVAARNYAYANLSKRAALGFDVTDSSFDQVYSGYSIEDSRTNTAVDATTDTVMTYGDQLIQAYYHSNSGGHTQNSEDVWSAQVPYLRGVQDPFSLPGKHIDWSLSYTPEEIEDILNSKGIPINNIKNVQVTKTTDSGSVLELLIEGSTNVLLEKQQIRSIFGYLDMKSTMFVIGNTAGPSEISSATSKTYQEMKLLQVKGAFPEPIAAPTDLYAFNGDAKTKLSETQKYSIYTEDPKYATINVTTPSSPGNFTFVGKGWGHGLGMSQEGAYEMALQGYIFEDILRHYYTGIDITTY